MRRTGAGVRSRFRRPRFQLRPEEEMRRTRIRGFPTDDIEHVLDVREVTAECFGDERSDHIDRGAELHVVRVQRSIEIVQ